MTANKRDYEVGYRKPPRHTQFKKGQSGNKTGRPKGKIKLADLDAALDEALSALIPVNENGKVRKISKLRALLTQTVNKGLKGHHPSTNLVLSFKAKRAAGVGSDGQGPDETAHDVKNEIDEILNGIATNLSTRSKMAQAPNDAVPDAQADGDGLDDEPPPPKPLD